MAILYLLSGNGSTQSWWDDTLPHFRCKTPIPLELPGFGANSSLRYKSLDQLAEALLEMTEPGQEIFAAGVNALVVLHALVRKPGHFEKTFLLAPVGAFLWQRPFAKWMARPWIHRPIHFLLSRFPKLFRKKFSSRSWTDAQYRRMGEGYQKCKAFPHYFRFVRPDNALALFEWIKDPIELIWGAGDAVLEVAQAAAWDAILPRAELSITLHEKWEHYPYIDAPEEFAAYMDTPPTGFRAHSKAGRLRLAQMAGLPVPKAFTLTGMHEWEQYAKQLDPSKLYAVRSSGSNEDQADHSHAGLNHSHLRVPASEVSLIARQMLEGGMEEVVIQEFVEPKVSGVAFVRNLGTEVEMVEGHLEEFISGRTSAYRATLSKMGGAWASLPPLPAGIQSEGFSWPKFEAFIESCLRTFHYAHADLEWAWDGKQFHLFQTRPVTTYYWRRSLTSANLDEILPKRVSRLMEYAQRRASETIPRIYARWDARLLEDNEPFTTTWQDASYINNDVFLARFKDWGLPSRMYAQEIGGSVPKIPFRPGRFLLNVPRFLKMQQIARKSLGEIEAKLRGFEKELAGIEQLPQKAGREAAFVQWFVRYYVFIVQQNMLINAAISSAFGNWFRPPGTVYHAMDAKGSPHRLKYESDPATPRDAKASPLPIERLSRWPAWVRGWNRLGLPGLRGYYIQVREWFRDNNMRLFHRLHVNLKGSEWLTEWPAERERSGSFWQSGGEVLGQDFSFVIYPGKVQGIAGQDILLVDALEPGHYADYQAARGVVSRTGGQLSHGATLLRELKKPSAVIPGANPDWLGKEVVLENGALRLLEEALPEQSH